MSRDVLPELWKGITVTAFVVLFVTNLPVLHSRAHPVVTDEVAPVADQPS
jgi:hypothetical protein